jgi:hypothetical protein
MNWKGRRRKRSWPEVNYYPGICLQELRKTAKELSVQLTCGPRFKLESPEYKTECYECCYSFFLVG